MPSIDTPGSGVTARLKYSFARSGGDTPGYDLAEHLRLAACLSGRGWRWRRRARWHRLRTPGVPERAAGKKQPDEKNHGNLRSLDEPPNDSGAGSAAGGELMLLRERGERAECGASIRQERTGERVGEFRPRRATAGQAEGQSPPG
jgi:hypothetical protein